VILKKIIFITTLVYLAINSSAVFSESESSKLRSIQWEEVSNKEGITVFKAKNFDHDSGLIPIKFKAQINSKIEKVLSVLADEKRKLEWMPRLKEAELIEKKSIQDFTVYYRYDAPWPFKDRDFVIKNLGTFDEDKYIVSVDIKSTNNSKKLEQDNIVRAATIDGYSIIKKNGDKTIVEMALLTDFRGNIPKFIVNIVQRSWPYKFMKHIRIQLDKKDIELMPEFDLDQDSKFLKK
jgi:hypothetical protein